MRVPGSRLNCHMDIVQRRSHHSLRSWTSVSYCTTVLTYIPGLLVAVSSDIVPWQLITARGNARLVPRQHPLSSPSSLTVFLVGSSLPMIHQKQACSPRYPLKKGMSCRCRVEPGALPTHVRATWPRFWSWPEPSRARRLARSRWTIVPAQTVSRKKLDHREHTTPKVNKTRAIATAAAVLLGYCF